MAAHRGGVGRRGGAGGANPSAAPAAPGDVANLGTLGEESQGNSGNNAGQVTRVSYLGGDFFLRTFRYTGTPVVLALSGAAILLRRRRIEVTRDRRSKGRGL